MLRLHRMIIAVSTLVVAVSLLIGVNGIAKAHGHIVVEGYELTIGFMVEPALVGEPNGLDLRVVKLAEEEEHAEEEDHAEATAEGTEEGEHAEATAEATEAAEGHGHAENTPVTGLEETLQAEVTYGSETRQLELRRVFGEDGAYTSDFIPMATGDYTFHIWGEIEGTPIDVEMTSSPDTFSSINPKEPLMFPSGDAGSDLAAQVQTVQLIAIAGVVLGLIGIGVGVMGMRRRS